MPVFHMKSLGKGISKWSIAVSKSVNCNPTEVTFLPLPESDTRLSDVSYWRRQANGLLQGSVLAPTLINLYTVTFLSHVSPGLSMPMTFAVPSKQKLSQI